ncbi:MAG: rhomboid family intramembrane serine protease [Sphingobacteriales bacterium]|nr:MAG: rhomboid family intramembrane serine protease [Sphingobacteriales bacterium]
MSITIIIVAITCIVSLLVMNNDEAKEKVLFWPYKINHGREYFRFYSGAFVHADIMHLAFNMITLFSFGNGIETFLFPALFGDRSGMLFILLYALAVVVSSLPDYFKYKEVYGYRALGASGAVSAVLFSVILLAPSEELKVFLAIPIPAWLFGILYLAFSAYMAKRGNDNIGHSAHFWGGVFGLVFTYIAVRSFTNVNILERFVRAIF